MFQTKGEVCPDANKIRISAAPCAESTLPRVWYCQYPSNLANLASSKSASGGCRFNIDSTEGSALSNLTLVARRSVCGRGGELPRPHISDGYLKMAVFSFAIAGFLSVAGIATIAHAQTAHDKVTCKQKCSSGLPPKLIKCLDERDSDPLVVCGEREIDYDSCVFDCKNSLEGAKPIPAR